MTLEIIFIHLCAQIASSFNSFNSLITLPKRCLTRGEKQEIFTFCLHLPTTFSLREADAAAAVAAADADADADAARSANL